MCFLDDMIDPLELRHLLIGNEKDKSRTALTTVLSTSKKRRCKVFLEVMINSEENIFNKFSSYLENEKPAVVRFLLNARETEGTATIHLFVDRILTFKHLYCIYV